MFFFAHTGLTLLGVRMTEGMAVRKGKRGVPALIDYRLVLLGAVLPDLIDKPLRLLSRGIIANTRNVAHSLLFLLVLLLAGQLVWWFRRRPGLLVLSLGVGFHSLFDFMWEEPKIWLWPFLGWQFPPGDTSGWLQRWIWLLTHDPFYYGPELLGLLILAIFVLGLVQRGRLSNFIRTGKLNLLGGRIDNHQRL